MDKYTDPHIASSALITIDTQNDFTLDDAPLRVAGTREVVPNIVSLLEVYREQGLPIVHVVRLYLPDGSNVDSCRRGAIERGMRAVVPGSNGAELVEELKPDSSVRLDADTLLSGEIQVIGSNEFVMYKPRWGAFFNTPLHGFLGKRHADTLVFTGCNYPNCPRTSIYQASERDYRAVLVTDALSRLYPGDEQEIGNIGVNLLKTADLINLVSGINR